ncbi:unnamed protein product [Allacma fusca]|uniref:RalBP1-associated Eps domain-containing protein 2 n=1 Tax=Allacma fusca TaxID=39272 RepID=A0A8J2KAX6_9HEXA|nr:unnamed protein product [Allacma fusca]
MEAPISKFMHVQQPDSYWHQAPSTSAFKSPDLIELNSDSERNVKPVELLNYSSSQEEVETEDDCCDAPESILVKEGIPGVYDVASNDEESCHLLQTEDDSENSDSEHVENSSKSSLSRSSSSAEATISDGEAPDEHINSRLRQCSLDNYWDMSVEQEKYYTEQFLLLQPDLNGVVSGSVAKVFFEKSKLPHAELREIWQLSDVTRDGCLDLNEFKTAMHLVVLRRHGLLIPSHFYTRSVDFLSVSSNSNNIATGCETKANTNSSSRQLVTPPQRNNIMATSGSSTASQQHAVDRLQSKKPSKDWTTFENEPVNFSSTCDTSGLVAPVPVRLTTPEDKLFLNNSGSSSANKAQQLQLKAISRPKLSGHHPKVSTGTIAPPPPPRRKTHVRSSSLDLNRLTISSDSQSQACNLIGPEVPARNFLSPSHQGGAFSVYRKPQPPATATIHEPPSVPGQVINSKTTKVQLKQEWRPNLIAKVRVSVVLQQQRAGTFKAASYPAKLQLQRKL